MSLRVAAVQAGSILFETDRTLAKAIEYLDAAVAEGAELVVFPEAFLGGYPKGLDFGARVGSRSPGGRAMFRRYFESAVEVPGPATKAFGEACRGRGLHAVMGCIERDGGTLYCTALFFSDEGLLLGKHRKVMPTGMERLIWGFGDGSTLTAVDTRVGRIGAVICWENYMPLLRMAMYSKGVQIYCAPTVDDRETWAPSMRHIAMEGRCFVVSACQYLRRGDCPPEYPAIQGDAPETVLIGGGSMIAGPLGEVLAGPAREGECLITADIDLGALIEGKFDLDVAGHYARPDLFRLAVNEEPLQPVAAPFTRPLAHTPAASPPSCADPRRPPAP